MAEFLGFEFKRKEKIPASQAHPSVIPPVNDDGSVVVANGGVYGTYVDLDGSVRSESELVSKYREMSQHPEVETAIDEIVNEVITQEPEVKLVTLVLDEMDQPAKVKDLIQREFDGVLKLLEFNALSYDIFKRWYVDGRLYYQSIIDKSKPYLGIQELRYIDPRKIKKIREVKQEAGRAGVETSRVVDEYFIYNPKGYAKTSGNSSTPNSNSGGVKLSKDSIVFCTSGLSSVNNDIMLSYLHKAIKPLNNLRSMEDSLIIYRISRAPERRIFYIDVGNLPKQKAEQYMRDMMAKFKNKVVYDSDTGEIKDSRKYMSMLEDFWLPRNGEGKGTEITTLPGGQGLGNLADVEYFQKNLFSSLNVPVTRLNPELQFGIGRSSEITREEVKFSKFINRLRNKFATLFTSILEKQLILKGIITPEDWEVFKDQIQYQFSRDNYYAELKETEVLNSRLAAAETMAQYVGTYYSHDYIRRNILKQSDEQIKKIDEEIMLETKNPIYNPPAPEQPEQDSGSPEI